MRNLPVLTSFMTVALLCGSAETMQGRSVEQAPQAPATAPQPGRVTDVDPRQAWGILQADPAAVILDVRTAAEYYFVGHPAAAVNIPLEFWDERTYQWSPNPGFDDAVKERLDRNAAVIAMCRSAHRSRKAAERLVALGFTKVFNMTESFEGDADPVTRMRTVNGWKNRGLPYTYDIDPKLIYRPR